MMLPLLQKHIDRGRRMDCDKCPFALAMQDVGVHRPFVGVTSMFGVVDGDVVWIDMPDPMRRFIGRFDGERSVTPHNFRVPDLERLVA